MRCQVDAALTPPRGWRSVAWYESNNVCRPLKRALDQFPDLTPGLRPGLPSAAASRLVNGSNQAANRQPINCDSLS